jgi:hypothetical protein
MNLNLSKEQSKDKEVSKSGLKAPEQMTDEEFDMKGTSRKEYENEYYKRICSEVIDNFLYLGSDHIA